MKKIILFTASIVVIQIAKGQTEKGNIMAGGNIANVQATFQSGNSTLGLNINPKMGYFVGKDFAIGLGLNFGLTGGGGVTTINYGLLPFARYYFSKRDMDAVNAEIPSKRTRFFAEADFGASGANTINKNGPSVSTNGTSFSAGPGMAYFITPNVGLETLVKVRGIAGFGASAIAIQPELNIGFQIYLSKNRAKRIYEEEKRNMEK